MPEPSTRTPKRFNVLSEIGRAVTEYFSPIALLRRPPKEPEAFQIRHLKVSGGGKVSLEISNPAVRYLKRAMRHSKPIQMSFSFNVPVVPLSSVAPISGTPYNAILGSEIMHYDRYFPEQHIHTETLESARLVEWDDRHLKGYSPEGVTQRHIELDRLGYNREVVTSASVRSVDDKLKWATMEIPESRKFDILTFLRVLQAVPINIKVKISDVM